MNNKWINLRTECGFIHKKKFRTTQSLRSAMTTTETSTTTTTSTRRKKTRSIILLYVNLCEAAICVKYATYLNTITRQVNVRSKTTKKKIQMIKSTISYVFLMFVAYVFFCCSKIFFHHIQCFHCCFIFIAQFLLLFTTRLFISFQSMLSLSYMTFSMLWMIQTKWNSPAECIYVVLRSERAVVVNTESK